MRKLFTLHNLEMGFCLAVYISIPFVLVALLFSLCYALFKVLGIYIFIVPASIILFSIIGFIYNTFNHNKNQ